MGGADSKNYTSKILNIVMNNKFKDFNFNVVVGQNIKFDLQWVRSCWKNNLDVHIKHDTSIN